MLWASAQSGVIVFCESPGMLLARSRTFGLSWPERAMSIKLLIHFQSWAISGRIHVEI